MVSMVYYRKHLPSFWKCTTELERICFTSGFAVEVWIDWIQRNHAQHLVHIAALDSTTDADKRCETLSLATKARPHEYLARLAICRLFGRGVERELIVQSLDSQARFGPDKGGIEAVCNILSPRIVFTFFAPDIYGGCFHASGCETCLAEVGPQVTTEKIAQWSGIGVVH